MKTTHCPWCMKTVRVHKGRIASHVVAKGIKCIGIGQPVDKIAALLRQKEEISNEKRRNS